MADTENEHPLETLGDSQSPVELAETMASMSDSSLAKVTKIAIELKKSECGGAMEASGQTDGSCKVYNAALNELDHRVKDEPQR